MAVPFQTMEDVLITCGIPTNKTQIVNGEKVVQIFANVIFDKNFMTCMDKTNSDL